MILQVSTRNSPEIPRRNSAPEAVAVIRLQMAQVATATSPVVAMKVHLRLARFAPCAVLLRCGFPGGGDFTTSRHGEKPAMQPLVRAGICVVITLKIKHQG